MDFYGFNIALPAPCVCALGTFDGVHAGHRALLCRAKGEAEKNKLAFGVIVIFRSGECITTLETRLYYIRSVGADFAFVYRLEDIKDEGCKEFVARIKDECMTRFCVCGFNFRFGAGAAGDASLLGTLIKTDVMPPYLSDGIPVSSSLVRRLIKEGDMEGAAKLLGRHYTLYGKVAHGRRVGRGLGFPTANLSFPEGSVIPRRGVYVSEVCAQGKIMRAVTNVGVRPTFGEGEVTSESFIPDFSGDLYGEKTSVSFLHMIREEKKFESSSALARQIEKDVRAAKEYGEK